MTDLIFLFEKTGEVVIISIGVGYITRFAQVINGIPIYSTLEGLKFSVAGIVKEFPDLKDNKIGYIKREGLRRFKEHLKTMKTEKDTVRYLRDDMKKHGYKLISVHRKGFRSQKAEDYLGKNG